MNECLICYDFNTSIGEIISLACSHSMCSLCLHKLRANTCPFCRTVIKKNVSTPDTTVVLRNINAIEHRPFNVYSSNRQIHTRNRHGRIIQTYGVGEDVVYIDTFSRKGRKRKKSSKNNYKKGRWAQMSSKNRGGRLRTGR